MKKNQSFTEFGHELKKLRGKQTQREYCSKLGLVEITYRRYETGNRLPPIDIVLSLLDHHKISEDKKNELMRIFYRMIFKRDFGIDVKNLDIEKYVLKLRKGDPDALAKLIEDTINLRVKEELIRSEEEEPSIKINDKYLEDSGFKQAINFLHTIFMCGTEAVKESALKSLEAIEELAILGAPLTAKKLIDLEKKADLVERTINDFQKKQGYKGRN